ncbi:sulfite exporter TauE/SafE family protein [Kribbella turkmenica]|uniref:Probable membrane transporter protein n=1 Tax=Kribbella turkmenica TaxID=2530375 RepID=A0A4R4WDM6_9ACTN|nr:TSUP family transporter [Kribbella turkmenica]TDD16932.1 sulfite exporter TauE/SafE family protein [Kribbella turkmenica]
MPDLSLWTLIFLVVAAFAAGWIDAVVGGGGLIQLPAMLLGLPGATPAQILSTNKISSLCGTTTSAVTFGVKVRPDKRTVIPLAILAGLGSAAGALVATRIPMSWFKPIVLVLLVGVAIYTAMKPSLGARTALRFDGKDHYLAACAVGVLIGFYDGAVGPGTGSFLIFALVGFLGYNFLQASAKAKIANVATNLGAIAVFAVSGAPLWILGLIMGAANMLGGLLGARTAVARGSRFVRIVFLVVVSALILRLAYDVFWG